MEIKLIYHLAFGPLMVILAIIFKKFPPKRINWIYGYRTSYSMRSQEVWDEANRFSINLMIGMGIILSMIQMILYFTAKEKFQLIFTLILLVALFVAMMIITEKHLKKHFDEDGNPRTNP